MSQSSKNNDSSNDEQDLASQIQQTTLDGDYDEDRAVFRSVAMLPAQPIGLSPVFAPPVTYGIGVSALQTIRSESKSRPGAVAPAASKSSNSLLPPSQWLCETSLPTVPMCYPVERTHVVIPSAEMSPQDITSCISFLCQKMRLAAHYESSCQAFLTASDGTQLSVQLFLEKDDFDEDSESTIVEVQRRYGKSETFYFHANKLLQVAKGVVHVTKMSVTEGKPQTRIPPMVLPKELMEICAVSEAEERANVVAELNMAVALLEKDRLDANELGLELLCMLTDTTKSSNTVCLMASKIIVAGRSEERDMLDFSALMKCALSKSSLSNNFEDDLIETYSDGLKTQALQVLSNAFRVCVGQKVAVSSEAVIFCKTSQLVSELLSLVRAAERRPHEAVLATQCLEGLMVLSMEARTLALSMNVVQAVQEAQLVGQCSHAILASESERVFTRLSNEGLIAA